MKNMNKPGQKVDDWSIVDGRLVQQNTSYGIINQNDWWLTNPDLSLSWLRNRYIITFDNV